LSRTAGIPWLPVATYEKIRADFIRAYLEKREKMSDRTKELQSQVQPLMEEAAYLLLQAALVISKEAGTAAGLAAIFKFGELSREIAMFDFLKTMQKDEAQK